MSDKVVIRVMMFTVSIIILTLALSACDDSRKFEDGKIDREVQKQELAGYMVSLGYDDWVAACSYALGREGRPKSDLSRCKVDFDSAIAGADRKWAAEEHR